MNALVPRVHVVRYEDALASPAATIQAILSVYGIQPARDRFVVSKTNMKASGSEGSTTTQFDRTLYYTNQHFLRAFDRAAYEAYVPQLDVTLEGRAGYVLPPWASVVEGKRGLAGGGG